MEKKKNHCLIHYLFQIEYAEAQSLKNENVQLLTVWTVCGTDLKLATVPMKDHVTLCNGVANLYIFNSLTTTEVYSTE